MKKYLFFIPLIGIILLLFDNINNNKIARTLESWQIYVIVVIQAAAVLFSVMAVIALVIVIEGSILNK